MTDDLKARTDFSHGFDDGNHGNAIESQDWAAWSRRNGFAKRSEAYREGMILGFFSSYALSEISAGMRGKVRALRIKHATGTDE